MNTTTLLVRKNSLSDTELRSTAPLPLASGQVRVQVESFALTANNITYAAMGDMLQYWQFFPAPEPSWGIVPVWGFGTVQESLHPDVVVGERLYGYWPMASEAVLSPHRASASMAQTPCCCPARLAKPLMAQRSSWPSAPAKK